MNGDERAPLTGLLLARPVLVLYTLLHVHPTPARTHAQARQPSRKPKKKKGPPFRKRGRKKQIIPPAPSNSINRITEQYVGLGESCANKKPTLPSLYESRVALGSAAALPCGHAAVARTPPHPIQPTVRNQELFLILIPPTYTYLIALPGLGLAAFIPS